MPEPSLTQPLPRIYLVSSGGVDYRWFDTELRAINWAKRNLDPTSQNLDNGQYETEFSVSCWMMHTRRDQVRTRTYRYTHQLTEEIPFSNQRRR